MEVGIGEQLGRQQAGEFDYFTLAPSYRPDPDDQA